MKPYVRLWHAVRFSPSRVISRPHVPAAVVPLSLSVSAAHMYIVYVHGAVYPLVAAGLCYAMFPPRHDAVIITQSLSVAFAADPRIYLYEPALLCYGGIMASYVGPRGAAGFTAEII